MPETLDQLLMTRPPTADRPLLGVMVLVVEDSRYACDAVRLMCQRSGARIRRAESLASANRHLTAYRPRVAIIDLGLPDGSGVTLIEQLARSEPRIDAIVAISGDDTLAEDARDAGADMFLAKPLSSLFDFQSTILSLLPEDDHPDHIDYPLEDSIEPDPLALRDDLSLAADLLNENPQPGTLNYVATFLKGLSRAAGDRELAEIGVMVEKMSPKGPDMAATQGIAAMLERRRDGISNV